MQRVNNTRDRFAEFYDREQDNFTDESWRFYPYTTPRDRIDPSYVVDRWNDNRALVNAYGRMRCIKDTTYLENGDVLRVTTIRRAGTGEVILCWSDQYYLVYEEKTDDNLE